MHRLTLPLLPLVLIALGAPVHAAEPLPEPYQRLMHGKIKRVVYYTHILNGPRATGGERRYRTTVHRPDGNFTEVIRDNKHKGAAYTLRFRYHYKGAWPQRITVYKNDKQFGRGEMRWDAATSTMHKTIVFQDGIQITERKHYDGRGRVIRIEDILEIKGKGVITTTIRFSYDNKGKRERYTTDKIYEQVQRGNELVETRRKHIEVRYRYTARGWLKSSSSVLTDDSKIIHERRVFTLDAQGNWTGSKTYRRGPRDDKEALYKTHRRTIDYYPDK